MAQPSPDYKLLYQESQRKLQIADEKNQEELRLRQAAEEKNQESQRKLQAADKKLRRTTLIEYLDACHVHLHYNLNLQDEKMSTRGSPDNAEDKLRPERIVEWSDFPESQAAIWKDLQASNFMDEQYFDDLQYLTGLGKAIQKRLMGSELDLNLFERQTVEDPTTSIIEHIYSTPLLREKFGLRGSIQFENHANTLSANEEIEASLRNLSVSENVQSSRLPAHPKKPVKKFASDSKTKTTSEAGKTTRPRADQFCVYNISSETGNGTIRIPAFIIEYKAPHKLHLDCIRGGLQDMNLEEVIRRHKSESVQQKYRRLVAAAITQAFSYMVQTGMEYGYVSTGEAFIFLRVPENPATVYYFLSIPKDDVGSNTGLASNVNGENRLHLTVVGQVLAFTLQALKSQPRNQSWITAASDQLKTWKLVYDELLEELPKDISSPAYEPRENAFHRMSPIRLRPRSARIDYSGCRPSSDKNQSSDDGSDFDRDSETPSRTNRQGKTRQVAKKEKSGPVNKAKPHQSSRVIHSEMFYCTQNCLLGLLNGGSLDRMCPNVNEHGDSVHQIDQSTFLSLIYQQLSKDLDHNCTALGIHGARGALLMIKLTSHGYTVAAKCTTADFVAHLKREAIVYERLRSIQGIHVPVYLGSIDLDMFYRYFGICDLVHMMFIGFGGYSISKYINKANKASMLAQVERSLLEIHRLKVLHRDAMPRNILWDTEHNQTMIIDFERAEIKESRPALGVISPNRKRKRPTVTQKERATAQEESDDAFVREMNGAINQLRAYCH